MDASWFRIVTLVFLIIASSGLLVMVVSLLGICGVWAKLFGKSGTERTLPAERLHELPALVLVCSLGRPDPGDPATQLAFYGSVLPAAWSLMLALRAKGLGTTWTTLLARESAAVAEVLGIPEDVTQTVLLPVAYTKNARLAPAERKPAREVTYWNAWGREPSAMRVSSTPVSDRRLARTVPADIASVNHDSGMITYAQSCRINGNTVPHLVIQGERGPITIMLMPEESVTAARSFEGENVHGVILPVGSGSIVIIGDREEQLGRVTQNLLDSVNWGT